MNSKNKRLSLICALIIGTCLTNTSHIFGQNFGQNPEPQSPTMISQESSAISANVTPSQNAIQRYEEERKRLEAQAKKEKELKAYHQQIESLLSDVKGVESELKSKKLSQTIQLLNSLITKIKTVQKNRMITFFPQTYNDYALVGTEPSEEGIIPEDSSLFTLQYRDKKNPNRLIDINIIVADDSIQEYLHIVNHPKLVKELINTQLITVKNGAYKALEKYREDEQFCERNIIINPDLLINIIFYNLNEKSDIDTFFDAIEINELEDYLLG